MEKIIIVAENGKTLSKVVEQAFWRENEIEVRGICVPDAEKYINLGKSGGIGSAEDAAKMFFDCSSDFLYTIELIEHKNTDESALYRRISDLIFERERWLSLYADSETAPTRAALSALFAIKCELSPRADNDTIRSVINYIINDPEGDLRQTGVAESLHINSTYLSTVFPAHTNRRFVDFVNDVRLRRAARLLLSTNLKIADIAERLEYHDMAYFSKLFKRKFGMTPSLYRIPENYNYQI